jgi:hypothetical protein
MKRLFSRRWGYAYGSWWMVQYSLDWTFSLGLHIDPVVRGPYGPYAEVHLIVGAVSIGRNPGAANNHSLMRPGLMESK